MIRKAFALALHCIFLIHFADAAAQSDNASDQERLPSPALSESANENLYRLGKVWGYLKYHHPRVTAGCMDWDAVLLNELVNAVDQADAEPAIFRLESLVADLNQPVSDDCEAEKPGEMHFSRDSSWLFDEILLGPALAESLRSVEPMRGGAGSQHYVAQVPGVGNPRFINEEPYADLADPDWRYRLLALFRYWNIIDYWFPYRDQISRNWDDVLREFIPRLVHASDNDTYLLEMMALIARIEDGHANLWSSIEDRPPAGDLSVPVHVRWVDGRPIVWRATPPDPNHPIEGDADQLQFGDVIVEVDGVPVDTLIAEWSPYYGASNEAAALRQMARFLLRGTEETVAVRIDRYGRDMLLSLTRLPSSRGNRLTHDRDGDTLQMLTDDVAYLKLSTVESQDVPDYLDAIADTTGLVIDIRNYPSSFMVFALGAHLVDAPTPFARFTAGDLAAPGTFRWTEPIELEPQEPHYDGKVIVLVDERSQSQSEYTAMAFRAAPGVRVYGSQTAGADGNISGIPLPGGHRTSISGIGVFYPDKTPTQKIGIVPDVEVIPTIAGIRAGRDEVLEAALRDLLQGALTESELREIARILHAPH